MEIRLVIIIFTILFQFSYSGCIDLSASNLYAEGNNKPVGSRNMPISIIFETDIGNDVDDALAMDMIYKYLDLKRVNLLAVCSNKDSKYSTEYIHLLNCWYGYPKIPIGKVTNGIDCENDAVNYAQKVCLMKNSLGANIFDRSPFNHNSLPNAVELYRKILARQPNASVTIVSVGFSTNIVRLLNSAPDKYSSLTGKELIAKKVKLLSVMAGSFGEKAIAEYNIMKDIPSAKKLTEDWPSKIVFTPFEAGIAVTYPAKSIENDFKWTKTHPVVEAYKQYLPMPYDRPTWDLIALLYVTENTPEFFTQSDSGRVLVDEKGFTTFTYNKNGKHSYIMLTPLQANKIKQHFVKLISKDPKVYQK